MTLKIQYFTQRKAEHTTLYKRNAGETAKIKLIEY